MINTEACLVSEHLYFFSRHVVKHSDFCYFKGVT